MGTYSFHESKNYTSAGEGGLLIINDDQFLKRAEIIREKGTNRSQFFRGMVDKYSWVDLGSSYLMNDVSAAYLWGNLEKLEAINIDRLNNWKTYFSLLKKLEEKKFLELPSVPENCKHNAHMFYIKVRDLDERTRLIKFFKKNKVSAVFHYIPLHSAPVAEKFSRFSDADEVTTKHSERLLRLPLFYGLEKTKVEEVCRTINEFYSQ